MGGPYLRLLTSDELRRIHEASLSILEHTGMVVDHAEARDILAGAGARVDAGRNVVYFPPELIEEKIRLIPRPAEYHGRAPEFDFTFTVDSDIFGRIPGGATGYIDLASGRASTARMATGASS